MEAPVIFLNPHIPPIVPQTEKNTIQWIPTAATAGIYIHPLQPLRQELCERARDQPERNVAASVYKLLEFAVYRRPQRNRQLFESSYFQLCGTEIRNARGFQPRGGGARCAAISQVSRSHECGSCPGGCSS